jgi:hypothetical protein
MKFLFLALLLSSQVFAGKYSICSTRGISGIDPGSSTDEISGTIIHLLDLTLFRENGSPSVAVKNFLYDETKNELVIEVNPKTSWTSADIYKPDTPFKSDDIVETFNRYDADKVRVQEDRFKGHAFRRMVSPYLISVEKVDNLRALFRFQPGVDFKKLLAKPQAALLNDKKFGWFKSFAVSGKLDSGKFSIQTQKDRFDFQLNFSEEALSNALVNKNCDLGLQVGALEAERLQRAFKLQTKAEDQTHLISLIINPKLHALSQIAERRNVMAIFEEIFEKGELKNLKPQKLVKVTQKDEELKKKLSQFKQKNNRTLLLTLPQQRDTKNVGLESFVSALKLRLEKLNFDLELQFVADDKVEDRLSEGSFQLLINDVVDQMSYVSCYLPEEIHPLKACGADKVTQEQVFIPLYEYRYFRVAEDPKLLTAI